MEFASGDRRDAEDAIRGMDGKNLGGRDITVCFSREVRYGTVRAVVATLHQASTVLA